MTGYTRNDTTNNIANGNVINASDLDGEFDAIQTAFDVSTGHAHDGTVGEGAPIEVLGPSQDVVVTATVIRPKTDNAVDLGSSSLEFKDLYIDGTANIDSLVADTADINGGTIDGATIGGSSAAAGTFTTATATTGNITTVNATTVDTTNIEVTTLKAKDGTAAGSIADTTGVVTLASSVLTTTDINGGTIDGAVIGGSSAAAGTFTTVTASGDLTISDKIVHSGDTNTAIRFPAADTVTVETGGAERLRVDSSGNVGIGTASPNDGLHLNLPDPSITLQDSNNPNTPSGKIRGYDGILLLEADTGNVQSNSYVGFSVDGTERMRITNTGNVGIGVTPTVPLHVVNASTPRIYLGSDASKYGGLVYTAGTTFGSVAIRGQGNDTGTVLHVDRDNSQVRIDTSGSERMRIDSSGNVGIGTSSPGEKLQVNGAVRIVTTGSPSGVAALQISADATNARTLRMTNTGAGGRTYDIINGGTGAGNLGIYDDTAGAYRLVLDASGNLGLGVTPSAWAGGFKALQVAGSSSAAFSGDTASAHVTTNTFYDGSNWKYIASAAAMDYYQFGGQHVWRNAPSGTAGNAITFTQAMTLDASGNLGIGTTSPSAKLDIQVSSDTWEVVKVQNSGGSRASLLRMIGAAGGSVDFGADGGTASNAVIRTAGTERARITSAGDLLVGTTSGSSHRIQKDNAGSIALQVYNPSTTDTSSAMELNVNYTGNTSGWFVRGGDNALYRFYIYSNGNMVNSNNSYGAISDVRLKENITDATPKLDKLNQVRVVNYNLIGDTQKQIGVIAQELEQIFPGMVEETADRDAEGNDLGTTTKSVKYSVFVPMLIKAIQELTARVVELENR